MSEKRMAVSLTVLELRRQKWTGGILRPAAGIRVNIIMAVKQEIVNLETSNLSHC